MAEQKTRDKLTRFLEIFPGILTWITLIGAPVLAFFHPVWISLYIIAFDLYWFLKGGNVAAHLMHSQSVLKAHNKINWLDWCERLEDRELFKDFFKQQTDSIAKDKL